VGTCISRRFALAGALALLAQRSAIGHTPYKQWDVYRRKHLLIGTCRADPESYPLGKRLVAIIADAIPESHARVTRARDQRRLASLITTGQLELIVLRLDEAARLARGEEPFAEFGPFPLHLLFAVGDRALVCREDFPDRHAWLVSRALGEGHPAAPELAAAVREPLPLHPGARAYLAGEPTPQ
jgi:hypothetical protein